MDFEQKHLLLILARDLASNIATPMFVVDPNGLLVFYNESAEQVLGRKFLVAGELGRDKWATMWAPKDLEGNQIPLRELPLGVALAQKKPAYMAMSITGLDGEEREIAVVAYPLLASASNFAGAIAIFWEHPNT